MSTTNTENKKKELTPQQEAFIQAYCRDDDNFGNATLAYAEAYGFDLEAQSTEREKDKNGKEIPGSSDYERMYKVCQSASSRLLSKVFIIERKRELLRELFEREDFADSRLIEIIKKGKDADALNAIKHRNDIKQRVVKKLDITTVFRPLADLSDEELVKMAGE